MKQQCDKNADDENYDYPDDRRDHTTDSAQMLTTFKLKMSNQKMSFLNEKSSRIESRLVLDGETWLCKESAKIPFPRKDGSRAEMDYGRLTKSINWSNKQNVKNAFLERNLGIIVEIHYVSGKTMNEYGKRLVRLGNSRNRIYRERNCNTVIH